MIDRIHCSCCGDIIGVGDPDDWPDEPVCGTCERDGRADEYADAERERLWEMAMDRKAGAP